MPKALSLALVCLALAHSPARGLPRSGRVPLTPAGVTQLVESRGGRVFCRGVVIQLGNSRFREVIGPEQLLIREAKHGHDLRPAMSWRVEREGRRLVIKFKAAEGDFGSGNSVEVQVDRSAFVGGVGPGVGRFGWSISTDVL